MPTTADLPRGLWKLITKCAVLIGVCGGILSIAGSVGTYFVMAYRVDANEKAIREVKETTQREMTVLRTDVNDQGKTLIRLEERIKSLQRAQGIPTE